jgi:Co/Zn/Cd efflux system component
MLPPRAAIIKILSPPFSLERTEYSLPYNRDGLQAFAALKFNLTSRRSFANGHRQENLPKGVMMLSNILGIIIGVVVIIIGLILLVTWWSMFIKGLMAVIPILLILMGLGTLVYFISEIKSKLEMSKEEKTDPEPK